MKNKNKKGMNPITAGAIGAGIGALAGAAAVVLSDEKTRKKIGKKIEELEVRAKEAVADTQDKIKSFESEARKSLAQANKKLKSK